MRRKVSSLWKCIAAAVAVAGTAALAEHPGIVATWCELGHANASFVHNSTGTDKAINSNAFIGTMGFMSFSNGASVCPTTTQLVATNDTFTMMTFFLPSPGLAGFANIYGETCSTNNNPEALLFISGGTNINFVVRDISGSANEINFAYRSVNIRDGLAHHAALVRDTTNFYGYLDGIQVLVTNSAVLNTSLLVNRSRIGVLSRVADASFFTGKVWRAKSYTTVVPSNVIRGVASERFTLR